MTDQIMQRDDFNVIEVMSEEIDGVIDEIQGKVRCKCLKVLNNFWIWTLQILYILYFNLSSPRKGNEGENWLSIGFTSYRQQESLYLTDIYLWRGLQVSGRM